MKEDLIALDKIINFYYEKQQKTRDFINQLDNLYKKGHNIDINKEIPKDSEYIKSRIPLEIILKCYAIQSDIAISKKYFLLSTQNQEHIFFAKLICMTIKNGIDFINNIMCYLKKNLDIDDIELLISMLRIIHKHQDLINSIRNHSIAHIDPYFTTYYDSMLNLFKMPFNEVIEGFIRLIQYIQELSFKINKIHLERQKEYLKETITSNIEFIRDETTILNKQEILKTL